MREKKRPIKTKELEWQRVGNTYLLFDKEANKTYSLDPIGFMVWIQCDGKTDIETIVDIFSVDGNRDIVRTAILGVLEKLVRYGLVKWT